MTLDYGGSSDPFDELRHCVALDDRIKPNAKFNGKSIKLDYAPQQVKFKKADYSTVMVPAKNLANIFGLYYNYSSNNEIITLARKYDISVELFSL